MSDEEFPIVRIDEGHLASVQSKMGALTRRQREVLNLVANGCTASGIARQLHLSPRTVEFHLDLVRQRFELPIVMIAVYVAVAEQRPRDSAGAHEDDSSLAQVVLASSQNG